MSRRDLETGIVVAIAAFLGFLIEGYLRRKRGLPR